jgi:hypothetical protein
LLIFSSHSHQFQHCSKASWQYIYKVLPCSIRGSQFLDFCFLAAPFEFSLLHFKVDLNILAIGFFIHFKYCFYQVQFAQIFGKYFHSVIKISQEPK